jgi:hypothetical protein
MIRRPRTGINTMGVAMHRNILNFFMIGTLALLGGPATADETGVTTGRVAGGIFVPTGEDGDIAKTSFVLQLTGSVQFRNRIGAEAEFSWIPINLDGSLRPSGQINEARQITALAGLVLTSSELTGEQRPPVAYLSSRLGFSRIAVRSDTTTAVGGWIGGTVGATQSLPPFSFPVRETENAFVLSPRAGFLIRSAGSTLVDVSVTPTFLFHGGKVTTQIMATIGFGMLGTLD